MRLPYYNGPSAIRNDLIRMVPFINAPVFAFTAPVLLRLIKRKDTFVEVGIMLQSRRFGKTNISSPWNIFSALKTVLWLFWDINIAERFRIAP